MNGGLVVEALALTLGAFRLRKIDFAVSPDELLVILGPNGAGKSVTLESIAGFHRPDRGRVLIGGRDVTALPPERRNVGFVVQNFGLFPHLTVAQNVAIARRRGHDAAARLATLPLPGDVEGLLAYFGIAHLAARAPGELSPGEKQRVALARALAGAPDLFLFDEPFSALDAATGDQLRDELKSFLRALAIPAIFVTHDRTDAMVLADKVVVLRDGAMMQNGSAAEIFQKPASAFVARFVGVENVLAGRLAGMADGLATLAVGQRMLHARAPAFPAVPTSALFVAIRGEDVTVCAPCSAPLPQREINRFEGRITAVRSVGPLATLAVDCGFPLKAYLLGPQARVMHVGVGSAVTVEIAAASIHVMAK